MKLSLSENGNGRYVRNLLIVVVIPLVGILVILAISPLHRYANLLLGAMFFIAATFLLNFFLIKRPFANAKRGRTPAEKDTVELAQPTDAQLSRMIDEFVTWMPKMQHDYGSELGYHIASNAAVTVIIEQEKVDHSHLTLWRRELDKALSGRSLRLNT